MKRLRIVFLAAAALFLMFFLSFGIPTTLCVKTTFVPGDARRFDPIRSFREVRQYAGPGAELVSLQARHVRSDGTIDLKAEYVRAAMTAVTYRFVEKLSRPPEDAPPLGAGGSPEGSWYRQISVVVSTPWRPWTVRRIGGKFNTKFTFVHLGMKRDVQDVQGGLTEALVPVPACTFDELWRMAAERGAPQEAVATIDYDNDGYRFSIAGTSVRLEFGPDCRIR